MSTATHSFDKTPKANSDLSKYFDSQEKRKREVKATYQIHSKDGSPKHGLLLLSAPYYQKINQKSSKDPVLPYQEALARKPQYKIAQPIRSQSLPRGVGLYPNHLVQANEIHSKKSVELYREHVHRQESLPSIKHSRLSSIQTVNQSKSPKSEESVIHEDLVRIKQSNQSEFANIIKKKYANRQIEKAVMKIKSKPLDYTAIESAFLPPLVKPEDGKVSKQSRSRSVPESEMLSAELAKHLDSQSQMIEPLKKKNIKSRKILPEINTDDNENEGQGTNSKTQTRDPVASNPAENTKQKTIDSENLKQEVPVSQRNGVAESKNEGQTPIVFVKDEHGNIVDPKQQIPKFSLVKALMRLGQNGEFDKGQTDRDTKKEGSESSHTERLTASHREKLESANRERPDSSKRGREGTPKLENTINRGPLAMFTKRINPDPANNGKMNSKGGKNGKKGKSDKKYINSYVNPLYKDGRFIGPESLPNLHYKRPKIPKKFKNSVKIQYPNVHIETNAHENVIDVSFGETSVDTDTYKYYKNLHKEYFDKKQLKRAELYENLMSMNLEDKFQGIAGEIEKFKVSFTSKGFIVKQIFLGNKESE